MMANSSECGAAGLIHSSTETKAFQEHWVQVDESKRNSGCADKREMELRNGVGC